MMGGEGVPGMERGEVSYARGQIGPVSDAMCCQHFAEHDVQTRVGYGDGAWGWGLGMGLGDGA